MARRLVDISVPLQNDVAADPPGFGPKIEYTDHHQSLPQILSFFPGLQKGDLPEGQGWAVERVQLSTHNGHASRRALALSPDYGRGPTRLDDRRGSA
jgi:hypothetical protein